MKGWVNSDDFKKFVEMSPPYMYLVSTMMDNSGWPRHRENTENREFGSYFFQTGKTQGILF